MEAEVKIKKKIDWRGTHTCLCVDFVRKPVYPQVMLSGDGQIYCTSHRTDLPPPLSSVYDSREYSGVGDTGDLRGKE